MSLVERLANKCVVRTGRVQPWYQHVAIAISFSMILVYTILTVVCIAALIMWPWVPYVSPLTPGPLLTIVPAGVLIGHALHERDIEVNGNVLELTPAMQVPAEVQQ